MELLMTLNSVANRYKNKMKKESKELLPLDYLLIIHSVRKGKKKLVEISKALGKDRSYVYKQLKKMEEENLLTLSKNIYGVSYKGNNLYKKTSEVNYKIKSSFKLKDKEVQEIEELLKKVESSILKNEK